MSDARHFAVDDTLRDGTRVTIRAVRSDDRERIADAFRQLDQQSVYTRFFSYKRELSMAELARIDVMDFVRDVMLVVTTKFDNEEIVIGSARYIADNAALGARSAEVAFTIEETYQGQGLAGRLLRHLIAIARKNGIVRFEADVLPANKAMLAVFSRSGLTVHHKREGGVVHLTLDLPVPA